MFGYVNVNGNYKSPYKNLISDRGISEKTFFFPDGLPGFEKNKEFAFVFSLKSNPFILMNFCGETKFSFMCIDPFYVFPNYKPVLSSEDQLILNTSTNDFNLVFLSIAKFDKENIAKGDLSSGNLIIKSPIIINCKNYYGKQIVLNNREYFEPCPFKDLKKFE